MPPEGDHRYFTSTAVFLNEVIKLAISLTLALYETSKTLAPSTPATVLFEQIYNGVFSNDGWMLAVPAALYTFQNLLQYVAVENLDPVHFQVLYQVKVRRPSNHHPTSNNQTWLSMLTNRADSHNSHLQCFSSPPPTGFQRMGIPRHPHSRCLHRFSAILRKNDQLTPPARRPRPLLSSIKTRNWPNCGWR